MVLVALHLILALILFLLVNWIGENATDFGYSSTTLFEEPNESLALNFFIRALAPTVFIVLLSAIAVAAGYPHLRFEVFWIAIFYYLFRLFYIFAFNLHRLISWPRFVLHSGVGILAAWLAYRLLIVPNKSLLPDLDTVGNELWLAIFAFLYAAANKVTLAGGPGARRQNAFIKKSYERAELLFSDLINEKNVDDELKLITYGVLIYEDYCRPQSVRFLERLCFWRKEKTTGIMQVASNRSLTDDESVVLGVEKLNLSWLRHIDEMPHMRTYSTISDYNKDSVYVGRVFEVIEIIAKRVNPQFNDAYRNIVEN